MARLNAAAYRRRHGLTKQTAAQKRRNRGWQNVSRLRRKLRRMPDAVLEALRQVLAEGAQEIHAEALKRVPLGEKHNLARYLKVKIGRDGLSAKVGYFGKKATKAAFYAVFVEFGTTFAAPHPYMTPAADLVIPTLRKDVERELNKVLRKVALGDFSRTERGYSSSSYAPTLSTSIEVDDD